MHTSPWSKPEACVCVAFPEADIAVELSHHWQAPLADMCAVRRDISLITIDRSIPG